MKAAGRGSRGASPAGIWIPKEAVNFSGRSPLAPPSRALTQKGFLRVIASKQFEAIENGSQGERYTGRFVRFVRCVQKGQRCTGEATGHVPQGTSRHIESTGHLPA